MDFSMPENKSNIEESLRRNVAAVKERIAAAAGRAGRRISEITTVIVTKSVAAEVVRVLIFLGERHFGESRIQDALPKIAEIGRGPTWHLVGTLQRNKARKALHEFAVIHSIDSVALAQAIDRIAAETGRVVPVFLEVNVSGEETKHGFRGADVAAALDEMRGLASLDIRGLMTMAPYSDDPADARVHFAALRNLRDGLRARTGLSLPDLSMGMSGDFEAAVAEGATHLRIGTAFFEGIECRSS